MNVTAHPRMSRGRSSGGGRPFPQSTVRRMTFMLRRKPARRMSLASGVAPTTHGLECLESRTLFAVVDFTVNPALSTLRLSGEVAGVLELDEQHTGSLLQAYEGTIKADLDADSIEFVGGS